VVPRSQEIDAVEARLSSSALVAVMGGSRPAVSPWQVGMLLEEFLSIQHGEYVVSRFAPEDFLVEFSSAADADRVLHAPHPPDAQLIEFRGIPAHARNISTARIILDTSCSDLVEAPPDLVGDNKKTFFVCAWCIHPDLVPQEKVIFIQEPPEQYVESGLLLRPHEIIHSKHDGLCTGLISALWKYRTGIGLVILLMMEHPSIISIVTKMNTLVLSRDVDQNHGRKEQGLMMALDLAAGAGWGPPFKSKDQTLQSRPGADCGARWSSVRCAVPGRTLPGLFWRCSLCRSNGMSISSATGVAASFWSVLAGAPPCSCGTSGSLCFGEP